MTISLNLISFNVKCFKHYCLYLNVFVIFLNLMMFVKHWEKAELTLVPKSLPASHKTEGV